MRTPLTLITGFLGSGKTTLLRHILAESTARLAIVMNEFGEIGIDGQIIQGKSVQMVELGGGCVCCSLLGELEEAIREIIQQIAPEIIIVETTGLAEPDAIISDVQDSIPQVRLDGVIALADAYALVKYPQLGHTTRLQLEAADILLLNKIDLVDSAQLAEIEKKLRQLNPQAVIFRTTQARLDLRLLLGLGMEKKARTGHAEHEIEFDHFTLVSDDLWDRERFESFLATLPEAVYRAKGFIHCQAGDYLFNYVAGRWDLEAFAVEKTQLVFIGHGLADLEPQIRQDLSQCLA